MKASAVIVLLKRAIELHGDQDVMAECEGQMAMFFAECFGLHEIEGEGFVFFESTPKNPIALPE